MGFKQILGRMSEEEGLVSYSGEGLCFIFQGLEISNRTKPESSEFAQRESVSGVFPDLFRILLRNCLAELLAPSILALPNVHFGNRKTQLVWDQVRQDNYIDSLMTRCEYWEVLSPPSVYSVRGFPYMFIDCFSCLCLVQFGL